MTFNDIFKSSFLNNITSISLFDMSLALLLAFGVGMFIFFVYKRTFSGVMYSSSFGVTLIALTMITTLVILAVTSNVVLSLGMVGALSIVRFRTAVKEPMDLVFLFWSIAVGICCGAHVTEIAVVLSALLTILVIVLDRLPVGRAPMILVVNLAEGKLEPDLMKKVGEFCKYYKIKSRNIALGKCNLVIEVRSAKEYDMVQAIEGLEGVESVSLISHDGEVTF